MKLITKKNNRIEEGAFPSVSALPFYGAQRLNMPTSAELSERVCLIPVNAPHSSSEVSICRTIDLKVKK